MYTPLRELRVRDFQVKRFKRTRLQLKMYRVIQIIAQIIKYLL